MTGLEKAAYRGFWVTWVPHGPRAGQWSLAFEPNGAWWMTGECAPCAVFTGIDIMLNKLMCAPYRYELLGQNAFDGVPWDIYLLADPVARETALQAYLAEQVANR